MSWSTNQELYVEADGEEEEQQQQQSLKSLWNKETMNSFDLLNKNQLTDCHSLINY